MSDHTSDTAQVTATADAAKSETQATKTYTQAEFDAHMAGLKNSMAKKYEKLYADLGDPEELRELKSEAEQRRQEQQIKRGEFEKTLQELAQKKDAEITKRDQIIREYKVHTPILDAAARLRSVNPEQVRSLLVNQVMMDDTGEVKVLTSDGSIRYTDSGEPYQVDDLVREFLDSNPHFVAATPATTNTRSQISAGKNSEIDLSRLDMKRPEHRKIYAEARNRGQL